MFTGVNRRSEMKAPRQGSGVFDAARADGDVEAAADDLTATPDPCRDVGFLLVS